MPFVKGQPRQAKRRPQEGHAEQDHARAHALCTPQLSAIAIALQMASVRRLAGNYSKNTTVRLLHIALAMRNQMNMAVHDALSCRFAAVYSHVEAIDSLCASVSHLT
jgi:hypothetical protein